MAKVTLRGELIAMPRGGHAVEVDPDVAARIGAKHRTRVRGTLGRATFRSNLMTIGGRLLLGVHKATVEAAGARVGDVVRIAMELDTERPPNDAVPPELAEALRRSRDATAAWGRLSPSHRREYVGFIVDAKKEETRRRRAARTVEALEQQARAT